jgi:hypothetical protein
MTQRPCETCGHLQIVQHAAWHETKRPRCMRLRTARDGSRMPHEGIGSDVGFERDSIPEAHRTEGDKCGPGGRNWTPKKELKAI